MSPVPPRTHYLDDIIKIIASGDAQRRQNFEQGIKFSEEQKVNQANIEHQKAIEKHQQDVEKRLEKEWKDTLTQQATLNKLAEAEREAQHFNKKMSVMNILQSGGRVPGDIATKVIDQQTVAPQMFTKPLDQLSESATGSLTHHKIDMGGGQSFEGDVIDPKVHMRRLAELDRIQNAPANEAEEAKQKIIQAGQAFKQAQTHSDAMEMQRLKHKDEMDKQLLINQGKKDAFQAKMAAGGTIGEQDYDTYKKQWKLGIETPDQSQTRAGSPQAKAAIGAMYRRFTSEGGVSMNPLQQKATATLGSGITAINAQNHLLELMAKDDVPEDVWNTGISISTNKGQHWFKKDDTWKAHQNVVSYGSQLAEEAGVKGTQSDKDTASAIAGNAPSLDDTYSQALRKRNENIKRYLTNFETQFHNYKGKDLQELKEHFGIDQLEQALKHDPRKAMQKGKSGGAGEINIPAPQKPTGPPAKNKTPSAADLYDQFNQEKEARKNAKESPFVVGPSTGSYPGNTNIKNLSPTRTTPRSRMRGMEKMGQEPNILVR